MPTTIVDGVRVAISQAEYDGMFPVVAPPTSYIIPKTLPWQRMTAEEAALIDAVMLQTEAQARNVYLAAQYLNTADPLWPTLWQLRADNLPGGGARANQLLAPET